MQHIVLDLEWNSVYEPTLRTYLHEIIEIGAVRLDGDLREHDSFSILVKAQVARSLRSHVSKLMHICFEDLADAPPFAEALTLFKDWLVTPPFPAQETRVLSWADGDMRVLLQNQNYFLQTQDLAWLGGYVDLQNVFQKNFGLSPALQTGLAAAAQRLCLDEKDFAAHRALDDARLTSAILRALYNEKEFAAVHKRCDARFVQALTFKAHLIQEIDDPDVDATQLQYICPDCRQNATRLSEWRFWGKGFNALFCCATCNQYTRVIVGFKKRYDSIEVKHHATPLPAPIKNIEQTKTHR
jgi:inhibitor of KinA sporulation pathway (predicted exonuclease)